MFAVCKTVNGARIIVPTEEVWLFPGVGLGSPAKSSLRDLERPGHQAQGATAQAHFAAGFKMNTNTQTDR